MVEPICCLLASKISAQLAEHGKNIIDIDVLCLMFVAILSRGLRRKCGSEAASNCLCGSQSISDDKIFVNIQERFALIHVHVYRL